MDIQEHFSGKWLVDGLTVRHVDKIKAVAKKSAHHVKKAAAAGFAVVGAIVSFTVDSHMSTESFAALSAPIRISESSASFGDSEFWKLSSRLLANMSAGKLMPLSQQTLALAERAVANKVDFEHDSVEDWAKKLLGQSA